MLRSSSTSPSATPGPGHGRARAGDPTVAGSRRQRREVAVVAERDQRLPDGRIDVAVGQPRGAQRDRHRLEQHRPDVDRRARRRVDRRQLGVVAESRARPVEVGDDPLDDGRRRGEGAGVSDRDERGASERFERRAFLGAGSCRPLTSPPRQPRRRRTRAGGLRRRAEAHCGRRRRRRLLKAGSAPTEAAGSAPASRACSDSRPAAAAGSPRTTACALAADDAVDVSVRIADFDASDRPGADRRDERRKPGGQRRRPGDHPPPRATRRARAPRRGRARRETGCCRLSSDVRCQS